MKGCAIHFAFFHGCADCHTRNNLTVFTRTPVPAVPSVPPDWAITRALNEAWCSQCRSKRGVVIYDPTEPAPEAIRGSGYNGPPSPFGCPGRDRCRDVCGKLAVHAETRALRSVIGGRDLDLVHVELAPDGRVVACDGPSCWQCSREIVDARAIAGVWLYQVAENGAAWHRYSAVEFHRATLERCGLPSTRMP